MSDNPDFYFANKKVINFEIIHYQCRGDPLSKTEKENKTVCRNDFINYPTKYFLKFSGINGMIYGVREI